MGYDFLTSGENPWLGVLEDNTNFVTVLFHFVSLSTNWKLIISLSSCRYITTRESTTAFSSQYERRSSQTQYFQGGSFRSKYEIERE